MRKLIMSLVGGALVVSSIYLWTPAADEVKISGTYRAVGQSNQGNHADTLTIRISPMAGARIEGDADRGLADAVNHVEQLNDLSTLTRQSEKRDIKRIYERLSRTIANTAGSNATRTEMDAVLGEALSADLMNMERAMTQSTQGIQKAREAQRNLNDLEGLLARARDIAERAAGTSSRYNGGDRAGEALASQYAEVMKELSTAVTAGQKFTAEGRSPLVSTIRRELRLDEVRFGEGAYDGESVRASLSTPSTAVSLMYQLDGIIDVVAEERVRTNDVLEDLQISISKLESKSAGLRALQRERQMLGSGRLDGSKFSVLEKTRVAAVSHASRTEPIVLSMLGKQSSIFSDHAVGDVVFLKSSVADAGRTAGSGFETMLFGVPEDANNDGDAEIIDFLAIVRTFDAKSEPLEKVVVFSLERS